MTDKEIFKAELDRLKEETSIGLSEHDNGVETGRMEVINALYRLLDSMKEEPAGDDLEEAAKRYNEEMSWRWEAPRYPHVEAFKAGAQWQKQQLMKDAVDGWLECNERRDMSVFFVSDHFDSTDAPVVDYNIGDKVKLIIIKED